LVVTQHALDLFQNMNAQIQLRINLLHVFQNVGTVNEEEMKHVMMALKTIKDVILRVMVH